MENAVKAAAEVAGGGGGAGAGEQDLGDGTVQCSEHRFKNISSSNSGGICAFCLQEKLGKLVSSSFPPHPVLPSSSSSPSPSFRSDINGVYGGFGNSSVASSSSSSAGKRAEAQLTGQRNRNRGRMIPFVSTGGGARARKSPADAAPSFKRSKSTTSAPRRGGPLVGAHQVDESSPRSRRIGFWSSIFYLSSSSKHGDTGKTGRGPGEAKITNPASGEEDDDMSQRKVSRSRSVGCGSRSFSGDFFERISSGFGDCTLRRVESQREGHGKPSRSHGRRQRSAAQKQDSIKERVKCGGIFSGFMLTTSSSSSSSSSSYWVCDEIGRGGGATGSGNCGRPGVGGNGRNRGSSGWAWAFASPMRAFSRPSSKAGDKIRGDAAHKSRKNNTAPDLNSIPSLLSVSG